STVAKSTMCMLAQKEPRSFLTGSLVDLGVAMSAYNAREFHHIYPKAYLAGQGIPFNQSNVIANICLLQSADNRAISDQSPATYMASIPQSHLIAIADGAIIPRHFMDGSRPYADFVKERADVLAATAQSLISSGKV